MTNKKIKDAYFQYLVGNEEINGDLALGDKINAVHLQADTRIRDFLTIEKRDNGAEKALFTNITLGKSEVNLSKSYQSLCQMALAVKTYKNGSLGGPTFYGNERVVENVIDGLEWLYDHFFEDQKNGYYGNWYPWEIGIPRAITTTLLLLEDEIHLANPGLIKKYIHSMDLYLRKGKAEDSELANRYNTAANLADVVTNRIIQGALLGDDERVRKEVENLLPVFENIDPNHIVNGNTDGFYEDGSFIQHHRVAYTGSYGIVLLERIIQIMIILSDSVYSPRKILLPAVKRWIYDSFLPVMYEGYMMEIVRGRAVSRPSTGYRAGIAVVEAMVALSNHVGEEERKELKSHVNDIVKGIPTFSTASFSSFQTIIDLHHIMNDPTIEAKGVHSRKHYAFNLMDKTVHRRESFSFAFSRSSTRISKYEYMNGENLQPWFQGDGAYYLYLSGRDQTKSYGVNFFATIDPFKLPGTTVPIEERKTIPERYNHDWYEKPDHPLSFTSASTSQNEYVYFPVGTNTFSGGVTLGTYGVSGIQLGDEKGYVEKQEGLLPADFVVYKNVNANKSAFMLDDEIVFLGSGIRDELSRAVMTTIDNRMFGVHEESRVVCETADYKKLINPENGKYHAKWVHFSTNEVGTQVGYYFPKSEEVNLSQVTITESLKRVGNRNRDSSTTEKFFTLGIDHGVNPSNDTYAYVMLPNADVMRTDEYAKKPPIRILSNTEMVHAVEHTKLGLKGFTFFENKKVTVDCVTSFNEACVLVKENQDDTVTIAISDPTFQLHTMKLEMKIPNSSVQKASNGMTATVTNGTTIIHVNARHSNGKSFEITLRKNS